MGMGRGFLAAGASGLVLSLWKVADESAARLMGEFYMCLANEASPPISLCRAQRLAIARGEAPSGWAGYIYLQG